MAEKKRGLTICDSDQVVSALIGACGNVRLAAEILDISHQTIYHYINKSERIQRALGVMDVWFDNPVYWALYHGDGRALNDILDSMNGQVDVTWQRNRADRAKRRNLSKQYDLPLPINKAPKLTYDQD